MGLIDKPATYRGRIADHAITLTRAKGLPQWTVQFVAEEIYDMDEQEFVSLADVGESDKNEITGYFTLFDSKDKPIFHLEQVQKVTGWYTPKLKDLNDLDLSECQLQFRVEEDIYYPPEGEPRAILKVVWIDTPDASVGRSIRKLSPEEFKDIDAVYGPLLKQQGRKTAPAKAPGVIRQAQKPVDEVPIGEQNKKEAVFGPDYYKKPVTETTSTPGTIKQKKRGRSKATTPPEKTTSNGCTKHQAWDAVVDARDKSVDDEKLAKAWLGVLDEVRAGRSQDALTNADWAVVRNKVVAKVSKTKVATGSEIPF